MKKGYKIVLEIIVGLLLVLSLGVNFYTLYYKDQNCKCVRNVCEKQECNCPKCDDKKIKDVSEIANFDINVIDSYSNDRYSSLDNNNYTKSELYLFDNGTYSRFFKDEIEMSEYGLYYKDNDVLYLSSLIFGGNGSTMKMDDSVTTKLKIKDNSLLDFSTSEVKYFQESDLQNVENVKKENHLLKYLTKMVECFELDIGFETSSRVITFC